MEPIKCELQCHNALLCQYTTVQRNVLGQRVPHTRTVYATMDNDAVVLIQGLQFTLYVTSDSDLSDSELAHWIQDSYCYDQCSRRALNALQSERDALAQSMTETGHFQENEWARCIGDEERRALFDRTAAGSEDAAALFPLLLSQWRQLVELNTLIGLRRASGLLYTEYRRLEDPVADRARLDADAVFVRRGLQRIPVHHSWPCALKLKDQAVWALQFENSCALELLMNKFHWPMEIGGVWFPERVEGRRVQMTLLEPVAWGTEKQLQLKFYEQKRGAGPHDYVLAQTPHLISSARTQWSFARNERAPHGGVLQPAAYTRPRQGGATASEPLASCVELAPDNRFAQVCALARHNAQRVRSNRLTLLEPLARLHPAGVLSAEEFQAKKAELLARI